MEAFGEEEGWGEGVFVDAKFGGAVFEFAILRAVVAIPPASGETFSIITDDA